MAGLISGRLSPYARTCVEWAPLTAIPLSHSRSLKKREKNGSASPGNIDAPGGYYKVTVPGEFVNEVQTQIGGISTE